MEKAEKYKARPWIRLEYSSHEEEILAKEKLLLNARHQLEEAVEGYGQTMALLDRLKEEWALGNLRVSDEVDAAVSETRKEMQEAASKIKKLSGLYDQLYADLQQLKTEDSVENLMMLRFASPNQKKEEMN